MIAFIILTWVLLVAFAAIRNFTGLFDPGTGFLLMIFVVAPFIMRIPRTKRTLRQYLEEARRPGTLSAGWLWVHGFFSYCLDYLDEIRLTRARPVVPVLLLGLSCWVLVGLSQAMGTVVFRLSQGLPVTQAFLLDTLDITKELPPRSMSLFNSFGSVFEEILWRGVFLSLFLHHYAISKAIIMAALGFSLMHLINILNVLEGASPYATVGQLGWTFVMGLWYGYATVKADSLVPAMLVHWLGNAFVYSFTSYLQTWAAPGLFAVYFFIFGLGLVPTGLMLLWTKFFAARWLPEDKCRPMLGKAFSPG